MFMRKDCEGGLHVPKVKATNGSSDAYINRALYSSSNSVFAQLEHLKSEQREFDIEGKPTQRESIENKKNPNSTGQRELGSDHWETKFAKPWWENLGDICKERVPRPSGRNTK